MGIGVKLCLKVVLWKMLLFVYSDLGAQEATPVAPLIFQMVNCFFLAFIISSLIYLKFNEEFRWLHVVLL